MKIEDVRVRKPLRFFGEVSARYMTCTLTPRPKKKKDRMMREINTRTKTKEGHTQHTCT